MLRKHARLLVLQQTEHEVVKVHVAGFKMGNIDEMLKLCRQHRHKVQKLKVQSGKDNSLSSL